jgi:sulfur carrier protein ThiS adenylyltransferase
MKLEHLIRQADLLPIEATKTKITMIGAGAVGSVASVFLAKMGFATQLVFDYDVIDEVNMNCQMYRLSDIGKKKVDALYETVLDYSGSKIFTVDEKFTSDMVLMSDIVITPVDCIDVRKDIFKSYIASPACRYLIDTRMSIEYGLVYVVDKENQKSVDRYKKTLHDKSESKPERCTNKSVMYTSGLISGLVCKAVKDISVGKKTFHTVIYNIADNDCVFFDED